MKVFWKSFSECHKKVTTDLSLYSNLNHFLIFQRNLYSTSSLLLPLIHERKKIFQVACCTEMYLQFSHLFGLRDTWSPQEHLKVVSAAMKISVRQQVMLSIIVNYFIHEMKEKNPWNVQLSDAKTCRIEKVTVQFDYLKNWTLVPT